MINSFTQFLIEEENTVYFTLGRMNPPTAGHATLLENLASASGKQPYRIYLTKSNDQGKNPLLYEDKIKFSRKLFPKHARNIIKDHKINTVMDIATKLYNEGFVNVVMGVDGSNSLEYDILLNKYNGKEGRHGFYNFKSIKTINIGDIKESSTGIDDKYSSKQISIAESNDFITFSQGLPAQTSNKDSRQLFNAVRTGMGLKEEKVFRNHVQLEPVSDIREAYVKDGLFEQGDEVVMLKNERVGKIKVLGANYVIVESKGETWRCWLDDVAKVEDTHNITYDVADIGATPEDGPYRLNEGTDRWYKDQPEWGTPESTKKARSVTPGQNEAKTPQDPDIKDREGTQPKRYHSGLSKATKIVRDRQFKKQSKMSDSDPDAYKPAPGDKTAKTKPSKYTTIVNRMVGEQTVAQARDTIARDKEITRNKNRREKEIQKIKHDRILDRARRSNLIKRNTGISEASFEDKSKASGVSVETLKKVYDRGVAAWKTGHRPGTTPSQWGHARVNAFIAKKKKGTLNHDKDLA